MTGEDIEQVSGSMQLCAGHPAGDETVVHSISQSFQDDGTKAVFLVDVINVSMLSTGKWL